MHSFDQIEIVLVVFLAKDRTRQMAQEARVFTITHFHYAYASYARPPPSHPLSPFQRRRLLRHALELIIDSLGTRLCLGRPQPSVPPGIHHLVSGRRGRAAMVMAGSGRNGTEECEWRERERVR